MNDAALMPRGPRYQVVFFDLYGTLIDIRTDERSETAWQALYEKLRGFGVEYESVEALRGRFARLEAGEMLRQANRSTVQDDWREFDILPVYRSLLIDQADEVERILPLPQAAAQAAWAFRQGSTGMIRLYQGALDMIGRLREAGVGVVLLSNAQSCYTRPE